MAVGDRVRVDAVFSGYYGQLQLSGVAGLEVLAQGESLPDPVVVEPQTVMTGAETAAAYEALLISVTGDVTALTAPAGPGDQAPNGEFILGGLRVNDFIYAIEGVELGDSLTVVGPLRYANGDFKIEPRSEDDVTFNGLSAPYLVQMGPTVVYLEPDNEGVTYPELSVELNRDAGDGGVTVTLSSSNASVVAVDASVTIAEGQSTADIPLYGLVASDETVTIIATLDDVSLQASASVLNPERQPTVASASPLSVLMAPSSTAEITLTLDQPAQSTGTTVYIESEDDLVSAPESMTVNAFETEVVVTLTAGTGAGTTQYSFNTAQGNPLWLMLK